MNLGNSENRKCRDFMWHYSLPKKK